ncbi:MAG: PHB depolymerase family esterase [Burkholderiales bacterium]
MIRRFFSSFYKRIAAWFRRSARAPQGRLFKGNHSAFGRTFALVQLTAGRRHYLLYQPKNYTTGKLWPMVVMLHGCREDADDFVSLTRMNGIADRDNFLVLYPEQRRLANSMRCWNWFSRSAQTGAGEAAILADMIRALAQEYHVDTRRIYIAGLSAGAAMANNLAVCHADLFAACALHSGLAYGAATSSHNAMKAMQEGARIDLHEIGKRAFIQARGKTDMMPAMVIHGNEDEVVNPLNAEQVVSQFAVMNELLAEDGNTQPGEVLLKSRTDRFNSGYRFEMTDVQRAGTPLIRKVMVAGLGHAWSGGPQNFPFSDPRGPNASEMICDFFAEHGLRDSSSTAAL